MPDAFVNWNLEFLFWKLINELYLDMEAIVKDKLYTVEEYFDLEESGELRHEFINGQLFEMSGASTEHYLVTKRMERLLDSLFEQKGFISFKETMKVKIAGQQKYFYPDVFITKESNTAENRYAKYEPELIVEVSSKSTFKNDAIDKLIAYQKIPSLKYYLLVDPENIEIIVYTKDNEGGWLSEAFTSKEDKIQLKKLEAELPLNAIYL